MSTSWRAEYLTALETRDSKEKANHDIFATYTKLADRAASLEQNPAKPVEEEEEAAASSPASGSTTTSPGEKTKATSTGTLLARLRHDLVEAQRSKAELDARLKTSTEELERCKRISASNSRRVEELSSERMSLIRAVKDRDEELKEKAKMLERVQDDNIALTLQLNMAEKRALDLEVENKDLVDRWMARKGMEADAMNDASKFS